MLGAKKQGNVLEHAISEVDRLISDLETQIGATPIQYDPDDAWAPKVFFNSSLVYKQRAPSGYYLTKPFEDRDPTTFFKNKAAIPPCVLLNPPDLSKGKQPAAPAAAKGKGDKKGGAAGDKKGAAPAAASAEGDAPAQEASVGELDIRVGRIVSAAKHPKADRLYVEQIDLGEGAPRTICSGLAEHLPLDQLQNAMVLVLANLKAIKLVGVESNGMVLCAQTADKSQVVLVSPPAGARVGERITFNGVANGPDGALLNPKLKTFDLLKPHLLTNAAGVACYKDLPFSTSAGPCTAKILNAQIS